MFVEGLWLELFVVQERFGDVFKQDSCNFGDVFMQDSYKRRQCLHARFLPAFRLCLREGS